MKSILKTKPHIILIFLTVILLAGCISKPSNSDAEKAFKLRYEQRHKSYFEFFGRNYYIDKIEIVEWGKYNRKNKYWPVKIHVFSTIEYALRNGDIKRKSHDETIELWLKKDDFGIWKDIKE
ncbi:hypothetical protein QPK87_04055 [Kamptonema cortianum]|nr:hypothetical protein [Kamptonema cortianum]MDL5048052.1 hypothetical protein [Oscillatoria amoena NRMC-F 0135]